MQKCRICGSKDFYKEAGYFFCQTCQTQNEDIRDEVLELRVDSTTRLRKTRIRQLKSNISGNEVGWTSWELYNFVLIGLTNELIELGVPSDIKLTVLQLWATYLGKLEVAFISTRKKSLPKLARRYKKRDADIIYGKVQSEKTSRKRKRSRSNTNTSVISGTSMDISGTGLSEGSSMRELNKNKRLLIAADYDRYLQSQNSSEGDGLSMFSQSQSIYSGQSSSVKSSENEGKVQFSSHAKEEARKIKRLSKNIPRFRRAKYKAKHISTQYKMGPNIITPMRLWAIVYLALRIHNQPIQLGDMLRYGREGHLSYYKLDHLLPPELDLTANERNFLTQNVEITHKGMRQIIASMAKLLGVWNIVCPDFLSLVNRYCQELGLPRGIQLYTERLIALSPPKMIFDAKKSCIPNYEGRAMAFIIVVLKTLLALDGVTEYRISRIAEKINSVFGTKIQHGNITLSDSALNKSQKQIGGGECKCDESNTPCIIVHGGAGNFSDSIVIEKMTACKKAAINGYKKLINGETAVDAVEAALWWLECDEFFNCSYGSVLNEIGKVQMDASIMDGFTFKCGSVAAVSDIEHPITLAKYVMNNFPNSIFVGEGAKNLAKHADLNWISEGNMVSPAARIALHSGKTGEFNADVHDQNLLDIDILTNSLGTVGCVAYDGYSVAAGTTTGGLNKKLVGRVGDTPILGCGTYAIRNVGCSLTGHGESIMKLGLARAIVEDVKCHISGEEALHKHFSYMLKKFEQVGGGIVLQSDGRWATYFTSEKMPYAVIENDLITYGARLYEERREMYGKDEKNCDTAIERGLLNNKLFSFQEWQRYIECRKTILMHAHYPTKMKYCPDADGIDDLYLKFLEFISSKSNKNEREIKNSKHYLPEEIISAMGKHTSNLNINDSSPKAIDIFPPSLTPLHSYLQHLLDHPFYDIPNIARSDFFLTRIGYMTKSDALVELAAKCGIELEIVDSNVHFLEKNVPPFEQPRMPSIDELNQLIDVQDDLQDEEARSESVNDYLHAKTPCSIKFDTTKNQYYDTTASIMKDSANVFARNDFTFTETLPNGKLAIPVNGDSENKEDLGINGLDQRTLLENKLRDKYNIHLSLAEKEAIHKSNGMEKTHSKKSKIQLKRNAKGQFIKGSAAPIKIEKSDAESFAAPIKIEKSDAESFAAPIKIEKSDAESFAATENENIYDNIDTSVINDRHIEVENTEQNHLLFPEDINISDINIDDININIDHFDINDYLNFSDISFFSQKDILSPVSSKEKTVIKEKDIFFRPFTEYWMYDCIFSRVKSKNFAIFEKSLPRTFRWLLNECALIVEMSTEDLYEEVCLIENYHSHILNSSTLDSNERTNIDPISKSQLNFILNKW